MTPSCPECGTPMVADRYYSTTPDPLFFSDPLPPFPVWRCPVCQTRIDREEGEEE
ncbi:MAG TPA: hypothetical protein PKM13_07495 [Candidatus Bipolaricaulis anaerobius]|nr:hypothetical protein [Candidatus Bipolaricaulis anaerobius]